MILILLGFIAVGLLAYYTNDDRKDYQLHKRHDDATKPSPHTGFPYTELTWWERLKIILSRGLSERIEDDFQYNKALWSTSGEANFMEALSPNMTYERVQRRQILASARAVILSYQANIFKPSSPDPEPSKWVRIGK